MRKAIIELLKSNESAYSISKATGVSQTAIKNLRTGHSKLDNIPLINVEKLYNYAKNKESKA